MNGLVEELGIKKRENFQTCAEKPSTRSYFFVSTKLGCFLKKGSKKSEKDKERCIFVE